MLNPLSNLTSLTQLYFIDYREDLRCKGPGTLLATGGQLRELTVLGSPKFFAGWDPNPRRVLPTGLTPQRSTVVAGQGTPPSRTLVIRSKEDADGIYLFRLQLPHDVGVETLAPPTPLTVGPT